MCITDRHDMTLSVKVALNPNTTNNQPAEDKVVSDAYVTEFFERAYHMMGKGENCNYNFFLFDL